MIKTCPICGKEFEPRRCSQKYCSPACYDEENHRRARARYVPVKNESRTCPVCGKEFVSHNRNQKYCSDACRCRVYRLSKRAPRPIRTCPVCGKEFTAISERAVVCSRECRRLHRNKLERERNRRRRAEREPVTCTICGREFVPSHGNKKCCSDVCRRRAKAVTAARRYAAKHPPRLTPRRAEPKVLFPDFKPPSPKPKPPPKPPPKIFIAAAEAEHRPPTIDELLDWIFDPNRKLSGVDAT